MGEPRRRFDPLALAVHGVGLLLIVAVGAYLLAVVPFEWPRPDPGASARLKTLFDWAKARVQEAPLPWEDPATQRKPLVPPAGKTWKYAVQVEPAIWRDIALTYRTRADGARTVADTEFTHAGGRMQFRLGTLSAGDPSHANTRFPGFFLYVAYLPQPLTPGQNVSWSWPWQLPRGEIREGRVKRFEGRVAGWETVQVPAGTYEAARIETEVRYEEAGALRAAARETLWVAPKAWQVVRIVREGRSPDEAATRIVAELESLQ